jgi:hypothetical protein
VPFFFAQKYKALSAWPSINTGRKYIGSEMKPEYFESL